MLLKSRLFTPMSVCAPAVTLAAIASASIAMASIAAAPVAAADPVLPTAGSENANDTVNDLQSDGYNVQINWVSGYPRVSLSQCWVNNINTAAGSGSLPTAYVDIECPK